MRKRQTMILATFLPGVVALAFSGCSTPGSSYAKAHPELSPVHRRILKSGKIPGGNAVAGMTREQVKLAMGGNPATTNGEDVWIYSGTRPSEANSIYNPPSSFDTNRNITETDAFAAAYKKVDTIIFFQGNQATHAQISEDRP